MALFAKPLKQFTGFDTLPSILLKTARGFAAKPLNRFNGVVVYCLNCSGALPPLQRTIRRQPYYIARIEIG